MDDLFELETTPDAGTGDGGTGDTGSTGASASDGAGGGGQSGAGGDAGAAAASTEASASGAPAAPAAFDFNEWASTPEGREQLGSTFESWASDRQAAQAAAEAAAAAAAENPFADIEEGLGLLGIDAARFREYLGVQNAPLTEAAQKIQAQESIAWVDGQLTELATTKPDLLGEGVAKLAEIVGEDGQPLFKADEVLQANKTAVLQAASAIETVAAANGQQVSSADALKQAAETVSARDEQIAKIAVERYKRELGGVGAAATDLTGNGSSGVGSTGDIGGDEMTVARRIIREAAFGR
jgi:hypothetical protein